MSVNKLFSFGGRMNRGDFWLLTIVPGIANMVVFALLSNNPSALVAIVGVIVIIFAFIIQLATQVKRWHDRDKSGFWILISFMPIVGAIWATIEQGFLRGTDGSNRYGTSASGSPFGG